MSLKVFRFAQEENVRKNWSMAINVGEKITIHVDKYSSNKSSIIASKRFSRTINSDRVPFLMSSESVIVTKFHS